MRYFSLPDGFRCGYRAEGQYKDLLDKIGDIAGMADGEISAEVIYHLPKELCVDHPVRWRSLFHCGMHQILSDGRAMMIHGALVGNTLVCGRSGVGKSTLTRRVSECGEVFADDCALLSFANGALYAQGCPTWSDYIVPREVKRKYDIRKATEVRRVYFLERGDRPEISTMPERLSMGHLLTAVNELNFVVMKYLLDAEGMKKYQNNQVAFLTRLRQSVSCLKLVAPLDQMLPAELEI